MSQDTARPLWFAEAQWSTGLQICMTSIETAKVVGYTNDVEDATVFSLIVAPGADALGMLCFAIAMDDWHKETLHILVDESLLPPWERTKPKLLK